MNFSNSSSMRTADIPNLNERTSLLRQYALATEHYAWTVGELERQRPILSKQEYDQLQLVVEDARAQCERLRKEMIELPPKG
jgi:hypothetical protein